LRDRDAYAQDRARASSATLNFFPRSEMPKATTPVREAYSQERSRTPPATQRGREPYSPLVNSSPLRHGSPSNAGSVSHHTARPSENVAHPSPLHTTYAPPRDSDIDTKIGGEAGMAGVGRRGFAAAARAAMTDSGDPRSAGQRAFTPSNGTGDPNIPRHIPGMDGRRANAPAYLNIASLHREFLTCS
jgi:hypothetical protein